MESAAADFTAIGIQVKNHHIGVQGKSLFKGLLGDTPGGGSNVILDGEGVDQCPVSDLGLLYRDQW